MSVSLYCAVSSKNGNFLLTEENKTMSHGCPLLMRSLFTRLSLHSLIQQSKYDLDFEIEKTERFYLKTNEKNNTGDLKSDTLGTRGFFSRPDDTSLWRSRRSNKDLTETGNRN